MRATLGICLLSLAAAGCHGLKVNATMSAHDPLPARMQTNMKCLDEGPLCEIVVAPGDCNPSDGKIAIIDVDGLLVNYNQVGSYSNGENPVAIFKEKLTAAAMDKTVRGVILRINSPGGTVGATDVMYHELMAFRAHTQKPVVACILDVGAGGGYYLASGCDRIVAIPTALVGGIGCIFNSYYAEQAMEKQSVYHQYIKAGKLIDMGSVVYELKNQPGQQNLLQAMADEYHREFIDAVQRGRGAIAKNSSVFDGRIMTADIAVEAGLVDSMGHLSDAIGTLADMVRVRAPRTVMYCRKEFPARTAYAINQNHPPQNNTIIGGSIPGLDRTRTNLFLFLWQAEPTLMKLAVP